MDSRITRNDRRRRRRWCACGQRFTTYESIENLHFDAGENLLAEATRIADDFMQVQLRLDKLIAKLTSSREHALEEEELLRRERGHTASDDGPEQQTTDDLLSGGNQPLGK